MNSGTEKISLLSNLKFSTFERLNESLLRAKCYVMALGKNRNRSHFSKVNTDKAFPTLSFAPVVGHLFLDEASGIYRLGGHDYKLDLEELKLKSQCVPFGVVLPSETANYEDVTEEDGTVSTYLTCEVILWTGRYPELTDAFFDSNVFTGQSMEINYTTAKPLDEDPTYLDILDFEFSALCMLNKSTDERYNVEPAFPSAAIVPLTYSLEKDDFTVLMNELKNELSLYFGKDNSTQGGTTLEEKLVILEKFNKTLEELDFSIDEITVEELEAKLTELFGADPEPVAEPTPEPVENPESTPVDPESIDTPVEPEPAVDPEPTTDEPILEPETVVEPVVEPVADPELEVEPENFSVITFSSTYKEKREAARNALPNNVVIDADGRCIEEVYFYIEDMSDEYIFVERSHWTTEDYDCKYGRFAYTFDEATMTVSLTGDFEEMIRVWLTLEEKAQLDAERANYSALREEFEEYKNSYSHVNDEVEELISYRANIEAGKVFAKYEKRIGETVEFKELKENVMNYSLAELEKECIYIVGLHAEELSFSNDTDASASQSLKFSVEPEIMDEPVEEDPYGDIRKKYLGK